MFEKQLEFIRVLQSIRTPFLDGVIKFCDYFDRAELWFVLIPIIWLGVSYQMGLRIYYLFGLNHLINSLLKMSFALPRPFHIDPSLGIIEVKGYGFPSGAAQTTVLLSSLLLIYGKTKWRWILAPCYFLLISFSRLYLGVHFPMDILGGWIVGALLLTVFLFIFPFIEKRCQNLSILTTLIMKLSIVIGIMLALPTTTIIQTGACAIGAEIGIFLNHLLHISLPPPLSKKEFFGRGAIGVAGLFLLNYLLLLEKLNPAIHFFLLGLWISFFAYYLCKKAFKRASSVD